MARIVVVIATSLARARALTTMLRLKNVTELKRLLPEEIQGVSIGRMVIENGIRLKSMSKFERDTTLIEIGMPIKDQYTQGGEDMGDGYYVYHNALPAFTNYTVTAMWIEDTAEADRERFAFFKRIVPVYQNGQEATAIVELQRYGVVE